MKSKKNLFLCLGALLMLSGCYPDGPENYSDLDVVYTNYQDDYDFVSKSTYARPDKIVVDVEISLGDTTFVYMEDKYAIPILETIDNNMTKLGWTKVDISSTPDVLLTPGLMSSTTVFYSYWYDWWYGGYYPPYWGWYYPPYVSVSSYTTGNLIMTISDPNISSPINKSPAVWVGSCAGVVSWNYNVSRVTNGINQAFAQSSYLKTN
ncbi:MAG TPA: DUF4136 domain-containing protein [Flavobacterium sp.]